MPNHTACFDSLESIIYFFLPFYCKTLRKASICNVEIKKIHDIVTYFASKWYFDLSNELFFL